MFFIIKGIDNYKQSLFIQEKIHELEKENPILIVPEQVSFEAEKNILEFNGEQIASKIIVASFTRLCRLIFEKTGYPKGKRLDDITRNILIHISFDKLKGSLSTYSRYANNIDIINMLKNAFSEFKSCSVSDEDVLRVSQELGNNELAKKTEEIGLLYTAYEGLVNDGYSDSLDDLDILYDRLLNYPFFADKTVFINSFYSFTVQELNIIRLLLRQAKNVYIALPSDTGGKTDASGLFSLSHHTKIQLIRLAQSENIDITQVCTDDKPSVKDKELELLRLHMLRNDSFKSDISPENIAIFEAEDCYQEINRVALEITKYIQSGQYKYRDFALIVRDEETYNSIVRNIFDKYDIPYFMDRHKGVNDSPLMVLVLSLMQIIVNRYKTDDIMRYLKTGLTSIKDHEISQLENYVFIWNTDNDRWLKEFKNNPKGFSRILKDDDRLVLDELNIVRENLIEPIAELEKNLKNCPDGACMVKELYSFLNEINIRDNVKEYVSTLHELGYDNKANDELRSWELLINILDRVYDALEGRQTDIKQFAKILSIAISSQEISSIPQSLDQTSIISIKSRGVCDAQICFIVGANEGDFPKNMTNSGLFTDFQRERLISTGLGITSTLDKLSAEEEFIAYRAICMPDKKLFVSYVKESLKAEEKSRSIIVRDILKIFPNLCVQSAKPDDILYSVRKAKPSFELLADGVRSDENKEFFSTLKHYYENSEIYRDRLLLLGQSPDKRDLSFKTAKNANDFFGKQFKLSASQIEKYYHCGFSYFCRYSLNIKERKKAEVDALEYGSLIHYILEKAFKHNTAQALFKMPKEELESLVAELMYKYVDENLIGIDKEDKRIAFYFQRWIYTACVLLRAMADELSKNSFVPTDFELAISHSGDIAPLKIDSSNGVTVSLEGKVDRVDIMSGKENDYFRIIDYKTGVKEFNFSDIKYGINVQMLLYMQAIAENGRQRYNNAKPAGVLYISVTRRITEINRSTGKSKKTKCPTQGIALNSDEVLNGMYEHPSNNLYPVSYDDKKQQWKSELGFELVTVDEMDTISQKIKLLMKSMADNLYSGKTDAVPLQEPKGKFDACKYCEFKSVCMHESTTKRTTYIKIKKNVKDIIIEELKKELENGGGNNG